MGNIIILGSQWGDEGKGKIVDLFSERFDIVARYQGGHNAGHTVFIGERKFVLKLIPSGILRPGKKAVIGNGLVIDPAALLTEIEALESGGVEVSSNLSISNRAHVLFPLHRMMEKMSEGRPGRVSIGTTSRGIGPCYEDKTGRRGIRIADLLDTEFFRCQLRFRHGREGGDRQGLGHLSRKSTCRASATEYEASPSASGPWSATPRCCSTRRSATARTSSSKAPRAPCWTSITAPIPFVTSSSASAGGACTGTGVAPTRIEGVIGVSKAYITRVGGGPFPTEALDGAGEQIRKRGNEFGAVTGRPRRCGWFDVPLLRYTATINGFDSLVVTKLDVLDEFDRIPVCVGYRLNGHETMDMPASNRLV